MVHRQTLREALEIVAAWAVLFTVPFFIPQIPSPCNWRIGIVTTAALAIFSVVYFCLSGEEATSTQVEVKLPETTRALQSDLGAEELVKELERVVAWCERFRDTAISAQNVSPVTIEVNHLWTRLDELKGEYRGIWTLTRQNEVNMVAGQLRKASSALDKRLLDRTEAHVEGARQAAKSLIRELKAPPSS
jgi:hypothetical protein